MNTIKYIVYYHGFTIFVGCIITFLIIVGIKSKNKKWKHFLLNLSAIFISLFLFELYTFFTSENDRNVVLSGTFVNNKAATGRKRLLGYGPKEDTTFIASEIKKNGNKLIYNAQYSFSNGTRIVPGNNYRSIQNIFFLGCSNVFGAGLNDNQTLPYYFSNYTKNKYNVVNYAFNGYGIHQALMIVEEYILKNKDYKLSNNDCVVYSFIPSHINRAAGKAPWDSYGPLYNVENNVVVYKGSFEEMSLVKNNFITKRLNAIWKNSNTYKLFFQNRINDNDFNRSCEISKKMNSLLKDRGIRLVVLLKLPYSNNSTSKIELKNELCNYLNTNKIEYYLTSSIIDDLYSNSKYYIIEGDGHPNSNYNSKIARHLSEIYPINQLQKVE